MSETANLEERVARLEQILLGRSGWEPAPDAWRETIGMFADDPIFDEVAEECRRIREVDREAARNRDDS